MLFNSNLKSIDEKNITVEVEAEQQQLDNDLVYIFAGGELPTKFLENAGIQITKKYGGEAILKH